MSLVGDCQDFFWRVAQTRPAKARVRGEASRFEGGHMRGHPSKRSVPQWNVPPIDAEGAEHINCVAEPLAVPSEARLLSGEAGAPAKRVVALPVEGVLNPIS